MFRNKADIAMVIQKVIDAEELENNQTRYRTLNGLKEVSRRLYSPKSQSERRLINIEQNNCVSLKQLCNIHLFRQLVLI